MDNNHQIEPTASTTHVVIFPLPLQGPINCMLKLAELILSLSQSTLSITFINTDFIARRLARHSGAWARLAKFGPRFRFESVPSGVNPDELPGGIDQFTKLTNFLEAQARDTESRLRELLAYGSLWGKPDRRPATCIITDGWFWFMVDVAKELRVPLFYIETLGPCGLWTFLCLPKMVEAGDLPFQEDDLDASIKSIPGMEGYLRRRDLPSFCRSYGQNDPYIQIVLKEAEYFPRAQGHILNTFDDLEAPLLSHIREQCPNLYTIGPLHSHLKARVEPDTPTISSSNSLWEEDRSCLAWLDAQPSKSVLFVSIGSVAVMTRDQLMEFWHGLVNSKTRFLWVRRPGSIVESNCDGGIQLEVSKELEEGTKQRGYLASWVPQEDVLAHPAIGGFLNHGGWNSVLESMVVGVPMICWASFVDQQPISRVVSEVWGVGLDMKDTCDRVIIEKMIKELMDGRREEFATKADELAKLVSKAVGESGASYCNLNRLIDDIQFRRCLLPSDSTQHSS